MRINSPYITGSATITGNLCVQGTIVGTITGVASTASYALSAETLDGLDSTQFVQTGSFNSYTSSASSSVGSLSGSVATTTLGLSSSIGSLSSSVATTTSGLGGRITTIEGRYATTGSNTFIGNQVITGSLYITTDLIVQGSSSLQNITASAVSIGTNTVILNTDTPAVRFAGISVQDSGSNVGVTGSIFWDGLCNKWVYSNPSGIGYAGGMFLSGPRSSTLGSEAPLTCNYIAKSGGGDHLYDSCIYEMSGSVGINCSTPSYNLDVNGCGRFTDTLRVQHPSLWGAIELVGSAANQGGQVDFYGGTKRYAKITGEQESTNNGQLIYRTLRSSVLTNALSISSTGAATFAGAICTPSLVACVTSAAAITIDGYSKLSFKDRGTEYGSINASRYNFGGESTLMTFQSDKCFLFLNGTNCLMFIGSNGGIAIGTTGITDPYTATGGGWQTVQFGKGGVLGSYRTDNESMTGFNTYTSAPDGANKAIISNIGGTAIRYYEDRITFNTLSTSGTAQTQSERMRITSAGTFGFNCSGVAARTMVVKGATGCYIVAEFIEPAGVHSIELYPNKNCTNHISSDYMSGGVYLPLSLSGRECTTDLVLGANGNIGINNSNPLTMLQVSLTPNAVAKTRNTCFGSCGLVFLSGLQGTSDSEVGIFGGNDFGSLSAGIGMARANSGDWDTQLRFYTHISSTSGSPADITEKMRITGDNVILMGTTSTSPSNSGGMIFRPTNAAYGGVIILNHSTTNNVGSGFLDLYYNTSYIGGIQQNGASAVLYNTSSDYRIKEDLKDFNGLEKISAIKVYDFKWKTEDTRSHGVIAHELQEVLPYAVGGEKDQLGEDGKLKAQGVDYGKLTPILIKAIQEQQCMINTLKSCLGIN
jgi:hypothetical protein